MGGDCQSFGSQTIVLHHKLTGFFQSLGLFSYDKGWQGKINVKLSGLEVKSKALFTPICYT